MLKNDISLIVDDAINKVVKDIDVRLNDHGLVSNIFQDYIIRYIKQNKKNVYTGVELKQLYRNARTDFIRYMKEFYKK